MMCDKSLQRNKVCGFTADYILIYIRYNSKISRDSTQFDLYECHIIAVWLIHLLQNSTTMNCRCHCYCTGWQVFTLSNVIGLFFSHLWLRACALDYGDNLVKVIVQLCRVHAGMQSQQSRQHAKIDAQSEASGFYEHNIYFFLSILKL